MEVMENSMQSKKGTRCRRGKLLVESDTYICPIDIPLTISNQYTYDNKGAHMY
jgi:hypothetical protein